jgi:hypothetical protein
MSRKIVIAFVAALVCLSCGSLAGAANNKEAVTSQPTTAAQLAADIKSAENIKSVPSNLKPALITDDNSWTGAPYGTCVNQKLGKNCFFGNMTSKNLVVIYGDSHAGMWGASLEDVAIRTGWKMMAFAFPYCPPAELTFVDFGKVVTMCNEVHSTSIAYIQALHPKLLILTGQSYEQSAPGVYYTVHQWELGLLATINKLRASGTRIVILGNIPQWMNDDADCLAAHESDVSACMVPVAQALPGDYTAEKLAAKAAGIQYINTTPWVCAKLCVPIVGNIRVFNDEEHFTKTYSEWLSFVLQQALGMQSSN